jgi:hypothetical protein
MTATTTRAPAAQATPALSLEARMAAVEAALTLRLEQALVQLAVDSEHAEMIPALAEFSSEALTAYAASTRPLPDLYPTPVAAVLQLAARRLESGGWCRGATVDADGARCLYGAIQGEAGRSTALETDALEVLLEVIRREFDPEAASVPAFNDSRLGGPRAAVRLLESAAYLAHTRNQ